MRIVLDGTLFSDVTNEGKSSTLGARLREVENYLGQQKRLMERIALGGQTYWSIDQVLPRLDDDVEEIEVHSTTVKQYVENVCDTASEFSLKVERALSRCAAQWVQDDPRVITSTWAEVAQGISWLLEAGRAVSVLTTETEWSHVSSSVLESLKKVESSLESDSLPQTGHIVVDELCTSISDLGEWFRRMGTVQGAE